LYEHSNQTRSNFYGTQFNSTVTPIFNDAPTSIKNFKTLSYEGDEGWTADVTTNMQDGEVTNWKKKESLYFNFIKGKATTVTNIDTEEFSTQGLGEAGAVTRNGNEVTIEIAGGINSSLQANTLTPPGGETAAPDIIYYMNGNTIVKLGSCKTINENSIVVSAPQTGGLPANPGNGDFVLFGKDTEVNTSGLLGYQATVKMTTTSSAKKELFAVNSEIFISSE